MWHKLLVPLLAIASLFYHPTSYTRMVDQVSASVVRVTGFQNSPWQGPLPYVCSGEVIAHNRELTAAHCRGEHMLVDGMPATVLQFDEYYDLALLVAETHKPSITMRDEPVQRFEDLTAVGYAFGLNKLTVLSVRAFLLNVAPPFGSEEMHAPGIIVQGVYIGGMSGCPVVDSHGQMVGIVQESNTGVGYGVSTLIIRAFLLGVE